MAKNEISLDQVNRRLAGMKRLDGSYDDFGEATEHDEAGNDSAAPSGMAFTGVAVVAFAVVASGTYFFAGGSGLALPDLTLPDMVRFWQ